MLHIRYQNNFADKMWFMVRSYSRSPLLLIACAIWGVLLFQQHGKLHHPHLPLVARVGVIAALSLLIFGCILVCTGAVILFRMLYKPNKAFLAENSLTIGDDSLTVENPFARLELKWAVLTRIVRTRRYLLAYISPSKAYMIPRRAFPDAESYDEFYQQLQSHRQKAAVS